jgi:guanyl-specific ribonuclease Sa
MDRRRFTMLVGTATAGILAGCSGGGEDQNGNGPGENSTGTETSGPSSTATTSQASTTETAETTETTETTTTETETATETETETATESETETTVSPDALEIVSSGFERIETDLGEEAVVRGRIENTGSGPFSYVEAGAKFYNDAGEVLESATANTIALDGGETWAVYISFPGDGSDATDGEFSITDSTAGKLTPPPDGANLLGTEVQEPEDEFDNPTIVGRAENTSNEPFDYLEAVGKYYDTEGNLRDSTFTNVTDLSAGETWRFEIDVLILDPDAELGDHKAQLAS